MLNLKHLNDDRGFSLIELLVAISITGIVITLTGSGLYTLMNANQRSQTETNERLELEQALAFMTDEIKMSKQIAFSLPAKSTPPTSTKRSSFRQASGSKDEQIVLVLNPATNSGLTDPIIYYLADPPNKSVWNGPRVIYRWGPTLMKDGKYSDGSDKDVSEKLFDSKVEVAYYNEVLIDRVSEVKAPKSSDSCDSIYSYPMPSMADRLGFYACIAADGKSVKLWMHKQPNSSGKSQSINAVVGTRSN
jgi:prepilin-type N-terminal cleavage/methylation domain-containing protein